MTNEQIKEVLDAFNEGKVLEIKYFAKKDWCICDRIDRRILFSLLGGGHSLRPKPEPVVITLYTHFINDGELNHASDVCLPVDTHKITYSLVDGEPDLESFKIEEL